MWVSMPDLIEILGRDMANTLCVTRGGVEIYVPHNPSSVHDLARIVGLRGMEALCAEFKGQYIIVPNGKREPHKERVHQLLSQGKTKRDIALECGVTERYVYYVAGMGPKQEQLTLL
ncbi:MAG: RNA helicase [Desulfovibrionaceae bacterium]|nr:RNA helicase [Desulfovibrionaceae bacterium]